MKVKVIIAALLLAGAGMSANAQSTDDNWFLQGQLGASYSLDGTGIGKLISPAGQIAAGKYFNPYVGARLCFRHLLRFSAHTLRMKIFKNRF